MFLFPYLFIFFLGKKGLVFGNTESAQGEVYWRIMGLTARKDSNYLKFPRPW